MASEMDRAIEPVPPESGSVAQGVDLDGPPSFRGELVHFLKHEKRWWLGGVLVLTALVGGLAWFANGHTGDVFLYQLR